MRLQRKASLWLTMTFVGLSLNAVCSSPANSEDRDEPRVPHDGILALQKVSDDDFLPDITRQFPPQYGASGLVPVTVPALNPFADACPQCDASVYSYCSLKMLHDSCCCDFIGTRFKPPQCLFADCSLLYAKSCFEYALLQQCCCNK